MENIKEKVAVVTGAASGIGRGLAVNLAKEGCHLALSDINEEGLKETAEMVADKGLKVTIHTVDVSDKEEMYAFAGEVVKEHGGVDIVINNAGTSLSGLLEEVTMDEFEWLMGINFWGVVYGSMAFLPHLKQRDQASIVNISSVHGLFTNPGVGPYCSSKFAVNGFTQTLRQELAESTVRVSCVHPGGIKTGIVRNARIAEGSTPEMSLEESQDYFDNNIARTTSDKAARIIIRGIKKDKKRIMVGWDAHFFSWLVRLMPVNYLKVLSFLFGLITRTSP